MELDSFLAQKPLYYKKIDYARFPRIYKKYKEHFDLPKIIHIVGTNAKGSTGRALAHLFHANKKKVGHYSSPHIMQFNERIWLDGENISDEELNRFHVKLYTLMEKQDLDALSYFEYTSLLAMLVFCSSCEYVVLEAGLGGEYDATNAFEKELSIVTPIDKDHEAFLGSSIKEIATTKLRSIKNDAILAKQEHKQVYVLALKQMLTCKCDLIFSEGFFDEEFADTLTRWVEKQGFPHFFADNFLTALCAFEYFGFEANIEQLEGLRIFGRCQKIAPNITIDVGHNPLGARAMLEHFRDKKVKLVYNSYDDKEYQTILAILKPIIEEVLVIDIDSERSAKSDTLKKILVDLQIPYAPFKATSKEFEYLVFGSFSVVEAFLKGYFEK